MKHKLSGALLPLLLLAAGAMGQPFCSIDIGPDRTICEGGSTTLQGPPGYANYLWSNGATTQDITVSAPGDYWCQVSYPSGELVTNGNFSAGNTGFTSQFTYSAFSVQNEGYYTVGPNASWYHNQFQGTGTGNFLIANAGYGSWLNGQVNVWCQTIATCPGQTYTFRFWGRTLTNELPARLVWRVNGVLAHWPDFTFPAFSAGWQQFTTTWTAGPGQTSVEVCLHVTSADGVGDDFGVDDISISGTVYLRDTVHVTVTPLPVVNLGPDLIICEGETADLDATLPGATYLWQDGSTNAQFHVDQPGNYSVTVEVQDCSNSDQVNVQYQARPIVDLGPDTVLCAGSVLHLDASFPDASHLWQDGSVSPTYLVTSPGTYWARATVGECPGSDTLVVGYKPMPVVSLGNDTTFCAGDQLVLNAGQPGASYLWQDGSTGPEYTVDASGNYQVHVDLNGCLADDGIDVTVVPLPVIDLGPDQTICPGNTATFSASSNTPLSSYAWNTGSTSPAITVGQPGTYSVEATAQGCTGTASVNLLEYNLPVIDLGTDLTLCAGESSRIGAHSPGAAYLWNTGAITDSITVNTGGLYWLEVMSNGCPVSDTVLVTISPVPVVGLPDQLAVCAGETATLDATTSNATYLWSNGAQSATVDALPGTWWVQVTQAGCTGQDTVVVNALPPMMLDLGPDTTLCAGGSMVLDATVPGANYTWNTGDHTAQLMVTVPGLYRVEVTDPQQCMAIDSIQVNMAAPIALDLGSDRYFCANGTAELDGTVAGATSYLWSNGHTGPVLNTSLPGTYWLQVHAGACQASDTVTVHAVPVPVMNLGPDTTLCAPATLLLQVDGAGLQFQWQDGSQGGSFLVEQAGLYQVTATNAAGCSSTAQMEVAYMQAGAMQLGGDTTICNGSMLQLNAGLPGGITQWSGASSANTPVIMVSAPGTYTATTTVGGCAVTDSIVVHLAGPTAPQLGPDTALCAGGQLVLTATGTGLVWDDGSQGAVRLVDQPGLYWVRATLDGCEAYDSITVAEIPLPQIQLGNDTVLCGLASTLAVDVGVQGGSYLWSDGATVAQRTIGAGTWQVQVTAQGCTSVDSIQVVAMAFPALGLPADTVLCSGSTWEVDLTGAAEAFLWSTGGTGPTHLVDSPGAISVTASNGMCSTTATVQVETVDLSAFSLGTDTTLCPGTPLFLQLPYPTVPVLWADGHTGHQRTITAPGTYTATATLGACTATESLTVEYLQLPHVDLGPDRTYCNGDTVELSVNPGNATVLWNTGASGNSIQATATGLYSVMLSQQGCFTGDQVHFMFQPVRTAISLGPDLEICPGQQFILQPDVAAATYHWSDGSNEAQLVATRPGLYWLAVTGQCLAAVDTVRITEGNCSPRVHVPNAFTPDGDGVNDVFGAVLNGEVYRWSFMIFDRWGALLFEASSPDRTWDGTVDGRPATTGVYNWLLHYEALTSEGVVQEKRFGSVLLLR